MLKYNYFNRINHIVYFLFLTGNEPRNKEEMAYNMTTSQGNSNVPNTRRDVTSPMFRRYSSQIEEIHPYKPDDSYPKINKSEKDPSSDEDEEHSNLRFKKEALSIMNFIIQMTEKQRSLAKHLLRRIEINDKLMCDSVGRLVANDRLCNESNIFNLICRKMYCICAEKSVKKPNRRSTERILNWISN